MTSTGTRQAALARQSRRSRPSRRTRRGLAARRLAVAAAAAVLAGVWGWASGEESSPKAVERLRAAQIPVRGMIDTALRTSVVRRAEEAVKDGCRLLVFHITSNGGMLEDGLELSRAIERLGREGVRTVAFVDAKAYSAAAITAFSCQEIVMSPESSIGDCAPILASPVGGLEPMEGPEREKIESVVRERMESLAERHGYPSALLRAMVTQRIVVVEARNAKSGEVRTVEEPNLSGLGPEWEKGEVVDSADELLTVGSQKALKYGIAQHVVQRLDDLYDLYPIEGRIVMYPVTWNEQVVVWLNHTYLKALLVLIGLLGIYIEMNTPGFGVPGTVALVAFGLLFLGSFLAGQPAYLPPILFVAGSILLGIELFVTPGFGVLGVSGLVLMGGGIVLALSGLEGLPERDFEWSALYRAAGVTAGVGVVFAVAVSVLARFFTRLPVLGQLVLGPSTGSDGSSRAAAAVQETAVHIGERGRSVTTLRPAGKARFGERLVDVVAEGDFLAADIAIEVAEVRGNRVVVRPMREE